MGYILVIYGLIVGAGLLVGSIIIYLVAAIVSKWRKTPAIWAYTSYVIFICLIICVCLHFLDGNHYIPAKLLGKTLAYALPTLLIPILLHKRIIRMWNMWIYSAVFPILIATVGIEIVCDFRPIPKGELESIIKVDLPNYYVVDFKSYSPGGDDWLTDCRIKLKKTEGLEAFYETVKKKCLDSESTYTDDNSYTVWYHGNGYYCFHEQINLEESFTINIHPETNTIDYHIEKI